MRVVQRELILVLLAALNTALLASSFRQELRRLWATDQSLQTEVLISKAEMRS